VRPVPEVARRRSLPEWLTTAEVAGMARVSLDTVRKEVFKRRLRRAPRVRAGFYWRDVLRWLRDRGQLAPEWAELLGPEGMG